jgi:solute carrier family 13 (sodium-dependent dicarboxylate transporter), member 2/3/5
MSESTTTAADLSKFRAYKSLDELSMTPGEARFEKIRMTSGFVLAPLVAAIMLWLPIDLPWNQRALATAFLFTIVLWLTEAIPIPIASLAGVTLMIVLGVAPAGDVLSAFGNTIVLLYLGAFFISQALLKHGLAQRIAYTILATKWVGNSITRLIIAMGVVTCWSRRPGRRSPSSSGRRSLSPSRYRSSSPWSCSSFA